ncbi:MAG: alkaline phosphatase family protein [Hyphomicrobiaceae bacterium]|nr:alkaline phosphatase family protein [Hyphomicrobiaceae bacterium]
MINETPLARFKPLADGLLRPLHVDYSFGNIPDTIEFLLTGSQRGPLLAPDCFGGAYPTPKKVVLFFVDSFGWEFWQQYRRRFRTTARLAKEGTLTPLSALFPSTTAASVATLNLGVLPAVHALYEWNIYIPAYGEVIQSLAFSPLGNRVGDACLARGYDPDALLAAHETVHQRLARQGVPSIQFAHRAYADSAFNRIATVGAEIVRHSTLAEALVQLKDALKSNDGKALLGFYWAAIDTIAHGYGPGTPHHAAEIASFWRTFDDVFQDVDSPDTLYLFTADHGHVFTDARETVCLNERLPELPEWLAVSPTGNRIYPNGSPRDVFLHMRPEYREEALALLGRELGEKAVVMTVNAALKEGLFGPQPVCEELRRRLGDILILPRLGHFVWWREPGVLVNTFNGHHGGLTAEELITVLGAIDAL